jgi:hypothetical protein
MISRLHISARMTISLDRTTTTLVSSSLLGIYQLTRFTFASAGRHRNGTSLTSTESLLII